MSDESYIVPKTEIDALLAAANVHGIGQGRESVGSPPGVPRADSARELLRARDALERRIGSISALTELRKASMEGAQRNADELRKTLTELRAVLREHELNSGGVLGLTEALEQAGATALQLEGQRKVIESLTEQLGIARRSFATVRGQRDEIQDLLNKSETALSCVVSEFWDRTGTPPRSIKDHDQ